MDAVRKEDNEGSWTAQSNTYKQTGTSESSNRFMQRVMEVLTNIKNQIFRQSFYIRFQQMN